MGAIDNIAVGDESANHLLMHCDASILMAKGRHPSNPLSNCAKTSRGLKAFNYQNPLYGQTPIKLLVPSRDLRRQTTVIESRLANGDYPEGAFFELRPGLCVASPELVFLRMIERISLIKAVDLGINLCGRYYLRLPANDIVTRSDYITSPGKIKHFIEEANGMRGTRKARVAAKLLTSNSGSPEETHSWIQFCVPARYGSFGLDFTHMNYDVHANKLKSLTEQDTYSIDIANPDMKIGIEYDGGLYHQNASADKRRRNELKALGWDILPLDATVLYDPDRTMRFAKLVAKCMGRRLRLNATWEQNFIALRKELGLPI